MPKKPVVLGLGIVLVVAFVLHGQAFATTTTTILVPTSYATTHGGDGGQPVANMDLLDELGLINNSNKYVEFEAASAGATYIGTRAYTLPGSISPGSIIAIQVRANYLGPAKSTQTWTWQIFDWVNNGFVTIGDNYFAPNSKPWTILTFNVGGNNLANYVRIGDGKIVLRTLSNNIAGDARLDYESLAVTSTSSPVPLGRSLYVSVSGNDSNPGTIGAPLRTISKAATIATPGSTVYVRGGVYNERVVVKVSGTAAGGYIQFQGFPGEKAIVDGSGLAMPPVISTPIGLIQITNRSYIIVSGIEVRNYNSNSSSFFPAGISITGAGTHLEIRHNRIHVINNGIHGAHGLAVYGTGALNSLNNVIVDGNELYGLVLGTSESMALNGNVQHWSVTNNIIHDCNNIGIDAIGFEGTAPDPTVDQARDGLISGNVVFNINDNTNPAYPPGDNSAGGIYVDGGTRIIIERNISHNNNIGLELASEHSGRTTSLVTARSNLIYLNTGPGISIGGFDASAGGTDHCTIINNTLLDNDSTPNDGSGEFQMQHFPSDGSATHNLFENNILFANSQGVLITNPFTMPAAGVALDFNLYFAPNGDPNSNTWQFGNTSYNTFSSYHLATGMDAHSKFANPQFLSTVLPQLWVQATSPAVSAGTNPGSSTVGTIDQAGFARVRGVGIDIGAYEQ